MLKRCSVLVSDHDGKLAGQFQNLVTISDDRLLFAALHLCGMHSQIVNYRVLNNTHEDAANKLLIEVQYRSFFP